MATRSKKSRQFDPFDPIHGYRWAVQLKNKIRDGLAREGRSAAELDWFLRAYFDFGVWDGLLIRARAGLLTSVDCETICRHAIDPSNLARIEARRDSAWREREWRMERLFDGETPAWMGPLLDWVAQVRSTDGY